MRTKSAQASAVLANPAHSARAIVTVYNSGGTPTVLDETSLMGMVEPTLEVEIAQDLDGPRTARVRLRRQQGSYSLAPLVVTGNPLGALINIGWRIVVEVELVLPDITATPAGLRETVFDGFIDELQWPSDDLELVCTDKSVLPRDKWIERERVYGAATGVYATKGCLVWAYDMAALVVGDLVLPSKDNRNGRFYRVTAASSAQSAAEPTWSTGSGATVVSGGVTLTESGATSETGIALETLIQFILNDNGLSAITLSVPTSPSWVVRPYIQQRQTVSQAIQSLVDQLGWYIRFEWSTASSSYVLRLGDPGRSSIVVNKTLAEDDEVQCSSLGLDVWSIRNVVRVVYGDSSSRSPQGTPTRIAIEVSDSASIALYGRRFMEVAEADSSAIDTASEATRLANAILSDLALPVIGAAVSFSVDPYLELGDLLLIPADGLRFTAAQTLAVQSLKHTFGEDGARTSVTLRGKPAARFSAWLDKEGRVNPSDVHQLSLSNDLSVSTTVSTVVGGTRFTRAITTSKDSLPPAAELHISESSAFSPSSATLAAHGAATSFELSHLVPGKTYYGRWVPYGYNASRLVRGEPSAVFSFVAGRAQAGHLDALVVPLGPPNGKFQTAVDSLTTAPPDQWAVTAGEWGASKDIYSGTSTSNGRFIEFRQTGVVGVLRSGGWPVPRGMALAKVLAVVRPQGTMTAGRNLKVELEFFTEETLTTSLGSHISEVLYNFTAESTWAEFSDVVYVPAGANYCRAKLYKSTASSAYSFSVASVELLPAVIPAIEPWNAPTFATNWGNVGGSWQTAGYLRDQRGFIQLRGLVKVATATLTTLICTLPSGYRPSAILQYPVRTGTNALSYLEIRTDGTVHYAGSGGGVLADAQSGITLDGVHFDTR